MEKRKLNLKQVFASIIIIYFILIAWKFTYQLGCFSLLIPILIILILASSFIEIKLNQKKCFKNCYFKDNTIISKILVSPYFTSLYFILVSIVYSITLMYDILNFNIQIYIFIIIFLFIVFYIYLFLLNFFSGVVNDKYLELFTREITAKVSALLLFICYVYFFINGYEPEYLTSTLEETLSIATNSIYSDCLYIETILRVKIEIEAHIWFYMKELDNLDTNKNLKTLSWIGFIIFNTISILGLNRLLVQIVYLTTKIFKDENGK